jgi:purine-nucleoside phosphorylase
MVNLDAKYEVLLKYINEKSLFIPDIAVILGSGLGNFANTMNILFELSSDEIPGYPESTVEGHSGKIYFTEYSGKKVLLFNGRLHPYEGYSLSQCLLPVFITYRLGCKKLLITNAAGGCNPSFVPGDLMLAGSVIGFNIKKELTDLIGITSPEGKNNLLNFPSAILNNSIRTAALGEKIKLREGIYWYNKGPAYETPAEVRMTRIFDADAVGMSTAHEAVFAAYLGMETSVISCITNYASGITGKKLNHQEVIETASLISSRFERLVKKIIELQ